MMKSAVLLVTMRCNIACAHCSVDSHPRRADRMPLDRALDLVRGLSRIPGIDCIDVSGGEPLLYQDDVAAVAREARRCGTRLRLVTNGFWARSRERAAEVLRELRAAGVESVAVSIDAWHMPFIPPQVVRQYIDGCRDAGMVPMVSLVVPSPLPAATGSFPHAVIEGLSRYGIEPGECLDMYAWGAAREAKPPGERASFDADVSRHHVLVTWQTLTAEGRARSLDVPLVQFEHSVDEPCEVAGRLPTVDSQGRLYPCCSPWINRPDHALDVVTGSSVAGAVQRMANEPLVQVIREQGPKRLIDAARARGVDFPDAHSGICNQCGLLMDRLRLMELRALAVDVQAEDRRSSHLRVLGLRPRPSVPVRAPA